MSERALAMTTMGVQKETGGLVRGLRVLFSSAKKSLEYSFRVSLGARRLISRDDRVESEWRLVEPFAARRRPLGSVCVLVLR